MHAAESDTLFDPPQNAAGYGLSAIEKSVFDSIEAIKAGRGISASRMFLAQTAMELARNIHKGNMKGRAVAHESAQLVATLELLDPTEDDAGDTEALPQDLKDFMHAFSAKPQLPRPGDPAPSDGT